MTSPNDLIEYPAQPGEFGRRVLIEALIAAGSPRTNSLTRLYGPQKQAWDAYQAGTGAGADNPDDETQPLAHVRGVAADIDAGVATAALERAGLVRPYPEREPWHWQVPGDVRRFAIIRTRPDLTPNRKDDMGIFISADKDTTIYWYSPAERRAEKLSAAEASVVRGGKALAVNKIHAVGIGWLRQLLALGR